MIGHHALYYSAWIFSVLILLSSTQILIELKKSHHNLLSASDVDRLLLAVVITFTPHMKVTQQEPALNGGSLGVVVAGALKCDDFSAITCVVLRQTTRGASALLADVADRSYIHVAITGATM